MWDEAAVRVWCEGITRQTFAQDIKPRGTPYLLRYFIIGWNPLTKQANRSTMYLHHFVASDPDGEVHSHPWAWGASLILVGGYREHRCTDGVSTVKDYYPGDVNTFTSADLHRVELLTRDCWTLFLVGPYQQPWGFEPACE